MATGWRYRVILVVRSLTAKDLSCAFTLMLLLSLAVPVPAPVDRNASVSTSGWVISMPDNPTDDPGRTVDSDLFGKINTLSGEGDVRMDPRATRVPIPLIEDISLAEHRLRLDRPPTASSF